MSDVYRIYPGKRRSFILGMSFTNQLIIFNVLIYLISLFVLVGEGKEFFLNNFALTPNLIFSGQNLWTFITSMFVHGGFFHIFANMFSLFFIGNFLERIIGRTRFFWVYILSGLLGGIFFVVVGATQFGSGLPGVGASGAIFGLLGVLAVLVPFSKIYLIVGPLLVIIADAILLPFVPAEIASVIGLILNVLIIGMIFAIFSWNPSVRRLAVPVQLPMWLLPVVAIVPLVLIGFVVELPIGNSAHVGGLVLGLLYGFYLRKRFPKKTKYISRHFS